MPATFKITSPFLINLKRLIGILPGGKSKLASYAAALFLTRTYESCQKNPTDVLFNLEEEFNKTLAEVESLYEDAPVNSTGSPSALGVKPGETIVPTNAMKKYKQTNSKLEKRMRAQHTKPHSSIRMMYRRGAFAVGGLTNEETTLQYHAELNPKVWEKSGKLKDEVRGKLMQIAEAWRKFADIDEDRVIDIIITGGNCNFNYTPQSDIDLHLVVTRNTVLDHAVDCQCESCHVNRKFVDDYLQDKKILWMLTHLDISIYGYPVELYAQDVNEVPHFGRGVYSVKKDEWIQAPEYLNLDFESDYHLQKKVNFYKNAIDKLILNNADDDSIKTIKDKIKNMRGDSIAKGGEFAFGNLVFKDLRNAGYLDKIDAYQKSKQDKSLSLGD